MGLDSGVPGHVKMYVMMMTRMLNVWEAMML